MTSSGAVGREAQPRRDNESPRYCPAARDELDAIWDYIGIENGNPDAADRLIETFFERFTLFAQQPLMGERCREFEHLVPNLRQFSAGSYIIYYTALKDGVRIGHVAHGAMVQEAAFRRWLLGH